MRAPVLMAALVVTPAASATPSNSSNLYPNLYPFLYAEAIYVETTVDTDFDGQFDRVFATVTRDAGQMNLPTIFTISPYSTGGNPNAPDHDVNVPRLPQDEAATQLTTYGADKERLDLRQSQVAIINEAIVRGYASVDAHSLGTGRSTGCPTVGDEAETLAAKAVIDWLNGRARAFDSSGRPVVATWANGSVGMSGISYNGTLPNMVATTGVEGLKAIIPIAAISNWYDYYRANGLVVGPGGYIGEDADALGKFIVRSGTCTSAIERIAQTMGREHGDFSQFWQARDYVARAASVRAAVFIIHGQDDWNVKQKHAIQWWEALKGQVPLRLWLHKGRHGNSSRADQTNQMFAWFDRYVNGQENGVDEEPRVEVESPTGQWTGQQSWPHEATTRTTMYLNPGHSLSPTPRAGTAETIIDNGRTTRLESMLANPTQANASRLAFLTEPLTVAQLLSGTTTVQLNLAIMNRRAANLTVALVDYDASGRGQVVTRGWADPQNHADLAQGQLLDLGTPYQVTFNLEPKQYTFAQGSRIGVIVTSTDYDYTIRPEAGTRLSVAVGPESFVDMDLSGTN